jgi:hypothetical protein
MTALADFGRIRRKNFPLNNFRTIDITPHTQAFGEKPNALPEFSKYLRIKGLAPRGGFEPQTIR